ncbi:MAG: hypothetical protein J3Q66DRAFT_406820 [Benniella sp.]|nr:MAG: hypothetical protein J3Q66DRAFT_406820 [Benniella sp.]
MASSLDIFIANEPGKVLHAVPCNLQEPIFFLLQTIADRLDEDDNNIERRDLFFNSIHLYDYTQPIDNYRHLGGCLTYLSQKRHTSGKALHLLDLQPTMLPSPVRKRIPSKLDHFKKPMVIAAASVAKLVPTTVGRVMATNTITTAGVAAVAVKSGVAVSGIAVGGAIASAALTVGSFSYATYATVRALRRYRDASKVSFDDMSQTATPGTNIEYQCRCSRRYQMIYARGFGCLHLPDTQFRCAACDSTNRITSVAFGFKDCMYRFHVLTDTGETRTFGWKDVTTGYQRDRPECHWTRLTIESAPLDFFQTCTICLEIVGKESQLDDLGCGHCYHVDCSSNRKKDDCSVCHYNHQLAAGRRGKG